MFANYPRVVFFKLFNLVGETWMGPGVPFIYREVSGAEHQCACEPIFSLMNALVAPKIGLLNSKTYGFSTERVCKLLRTPYPNLFPFRVIPYSTNVGSAIFKFGPNNNEGGNQGAQHSARGSGPIEQWRS